MGKRNEADACPMRYHIMTSCDRNLLRFIPVQLVSLCTALPEAEIDFYLFHRDMTPEDWGEIQAVCTALGRIHFHPVQVREPEKYDDLAADGGRWGGEAYYSLCAWQYLPETADRVLYMDAGDILIIDDIAPYYNTPFEGKMLIVTPTRYKTVFEKLPDGGGMTAQVPFTERDLETCGAEIVRSPALFNSGCYVINLDRMRREGLTMEDYLGFAAQLRRLLPSVQDEDISMTYIWDGDEGFLSAAFLGDLKLYEAADRIDRWYRPYDFMLPYYNFYLREPRYDPAVLHFAGLGIPKPWNIPYETPLKRFYPTVRSVHETERPEGFANMEKWYRLWYTTAARTDALLSRLGFQA